MIKKPPSGTGSGPNDAIDDAIGDIAVEGTEAPLSTPRPTDAAHAQSAPDDNALTGALPGQTPTMKAPAEDDTLTTPGPTDVAPAPPALGDKALVTPIPEAVSVELETPLPAPFVEPESPAAALLLSLETPGPLLLEDAFKTPPPTPPLAAATEIPTSPTTRDPASALPSIPPAKKESSGAFPLPGMAPPESSQNDDDVTLIARLSVLDDLVEESTKVEPVDAALRAAATKELPIALADQASLERQKALGMPAADRLRAAEFEDPGDDEDLTVSATPGIISITDENDDEEPTASQRPQGRTTTPPPDSLRLPPLTPGPITEGPTAGPRLPPPTPAPGRMMSVPAPTVGLSSAMMPLVGSASGPQRSLTPALPLPAGPPRARCGR